MEDEMKEEAEVLVKENDEKKMPVKEMMPKKDGEVPEVQDSPKVMAALKNY